MFNNKVYFLTENNHKKYHEFIDKLSKFMPNLDLSESVDGLISSVTNHYKNMKNHSIPIIFIELPLLREAVNYLNKYFNQDQFILISFYYESNNTWLTKLEPFILSNADNLFDYLDTSTSNINLFVHRLERELVNRRKIRFLQTEVQEYYEIGKSLASELDTLKLFEMIVNTSMNLTSSDAGTMYLIIDKKTGKWSSIKHHEENYDDLLLKFVIAKNKSIDIKLEESTYPITSNSIAGSSIITRTSKRIDDVYQMDHSYSFKHDKSFDQKAGYLTKSILTIPLMDNQKNVLGVIQLINKKLDPNEMILAAKKSPNNSIIPFDSTDELIMNSLAGQAAVTLKNNLLYSELNELLYSYKEQNEQLLFLSKRVLKAHEEERKRIAREIHDGPAQSTANLSIKLDICKKYLKLDNQDKAIEEISDLKYDISSTVKEIRSIIYDLKPSYLDGGLILAIENKLKHFHESTAIKTSFRSSGDDTAIEYYLASTIYRIVQESLTNISKHAKATKVTVQLTISKNEIACSISDNGRGFDISEMGKYRKVDSGFGLEGIKERIEIVRGKIKIISAPNKGTDIIMNIPL